MVVGTKFGLRIFFFPFEIGFEILGADFLEMEEEETLPLALLLMLAELLTSEAPQSQWLSHESGMQSGFLLKRNESRSDMKII